MTTAQINDALPRFQVMPYGTEKLCTKCREYWPDGGEFFYTSKGKTASECKACQNEARYAKRRARS